MIAWLLLQLQWLCWARSVLAALTVSCGSKHPTCSYALFFLLHASTPAHQYDSPLGFTSPSLLQAKAGQDPEAELQRQLARKLGLKKGKTQMGGEDGLDDFLEGK